MRFALLFCFMALPSFAADDYRTGTVVDAGQDSKLSVSLFGGVQNENANTITVALEGMLYTVSYQTMFSGGKNASSNFVVGTEVQARVHKNKRLWIMREDGKPLKANIVRRELLK